jgi:hypothetical protein
MSKRKIIQQIGYAATRRRKAAEARQRSTEELRDLCRKAQDAGVPITEIARVAELSRQGVYDLLAQRPGQPA